MTKLAGGTTEQALVVASTFGRVVPAGSTEHLRTALFLAIGAALCAAVWFQRNTLADAAVQLRSMPTITVIVVVMLGVAERALRADTLRRLLGQVSFGRALTIHDVGTAVTKGVPLGGPVATGLRWAIARDADISTTHFASALVGQGVAASFAIWILPFVVLGVEVTQRSPTDTDLWMLGVCFVVLAGSVGFWAVMLRSDAVAARVIRMVHRVTGWIARRRPSWPVPDVGAGLLDIRTSLRIVARRPTGLLVRTVAAQASGAVILYVALRGLGVGDELGALEFARVYFVVTLLSSFVPVPGGVGVVEVGLTGALVAAGVAAPTALAGVVVYRLLTYVLPIVVGAALFVVWRARARRPVALVVPSEPIGLRQAVGIE